MRTDDEADAGIGPLAAVLFTGIEIGDLGMPEARFVTDDAEHLVLNRAQLEIRIEVLERHGLDPAEERRALRGLQRQ